MVKPTVIERAYELARAAGFGSMRDLERLLETEGYEGVKLHLNSSALKRALRRIKEDARIEATRAPLARSGPTERRDA